MGLIETLCRVSQFQAAETKLLSSRALLSEEQQVVERAKLLRRMCRFKDVAQLLDEHPALARRNLDLAILHHEIRSSVSRVSDAQEALSAQIGGPPDEIDSDEGLGSMFAANGLAGADFAFDRLKTVWSTFGLKGVGVGLFPLLIRAIESIDGRDGTTSVLSEVDALPLVDTRAITLHLLAGFERLRLDGGETGAMLRSVALRCDRRAPFGHWREAIEQIADTDDRIRAFFPECAIDSARDQAAARRVVDRILLAVRARSPLSMIRLGDGEGNFLDYPSDQSDHTASDRSAVQRIWWDEPRLTSETCEPLRQEFLAAIRHADIVGVPEAWRLCRELPLPCPRDLYATTNQLRGLLCVRHHLTRAMELDPVAPLFSRRQLLTSCHISSDLSAFDLYDLLFAEIGSAVVVTCHATLANRLNEKFGLNVDRGYLIPPERKCSAQFEYHNAEQHFPDTFDVLRRTLMPTRDGEVFIVAAGFLGKIYCKWIRERGGIALDVGSMADYWCGFNTRSMAFRKMHFL